jgi:hypothetical protein
VKQKGVSELYASMLMIGVTLSLGSFVAFAALGQFGLAANSASLGAGLDQSSAEMQIGLVYAAVASSNSCPMSGGVHEGVSLSLALYNYGAASFLPSDLLVNATAYSGTFGAIGPESLGLYTVALVGCAHSSGQSVVVADSSGDEFQIVS